MPRRLFAIALAVLIAPGTWLRTDVPPASHMLPVALREIDVETRSAGPFTIERGWELEADDMHMGGYSALLWRGGERLLAASDNGRLLELEGPDFAEATQRPIFARNAYDKVSGDIEALAGLRVGGKVWAAAEGRNAIIRASAALDREGQVRPALMADWKFNSGPEVFVALPDGRFVAVAERGVGQVHSGIAFSGDPVAGAKGVEFGLKVPPDFAPVDAVAAPDGMLLVLLRDLVLGLPPRFRSGIARYRLADLEAGRTLAPLDWVELPTRELADNYEGIALRPDKTGGGATLWLISDDNLSGFQRSLLLQLAYDRPSKRARGSPARPF